MKNIEKYKNEIYQLVNEGDDIECAIATVAGIREEKPCYHQECEGCNKKCLDWMYADYKEQILTDDEKDIVRIILDFINKFGCTVIDVKKIYIGNCDSFISIRYENPVIGIDDTISSPIIDNDKFKGMEQEKGYTLKELGI